MAHYTAEIEAPVAIADAFDYLARFSSTAEWDPGVSEAEMLTDEPVALGSEFRVVAGFAGRKVPLTYVVTEFDRPHHVTVRAENRSTISEDTISFRAADDPGHAGHLDDREHAGPDDRPRTVVRYEADLRLKGPARLLGPVLGLLFDRIGDRAAAGLRASLLDRASRPSA